MKNSMPGLFNEQSIPVKEIPVLNESTFADSLAELLSKGLRVNTWFGDKTSSGTVKLYVLCSDDNSGMLYALSSIVKSGSFRSLTPEFPQVHLFEREIYEQTGITPLGHPWLKPVRFQNGFRIGETDFFRIEGKEIHEVAVGPVHAGIIEPGHFRFQCHGETIYHLEISLGYQHRGIEDALRGGPFPVSPCQIEAVAGDTSTGHMSAYCQILESLSERGISPYVAMIRAIALELERCANHTGDLGALAGDIGYLPTMSYCGRIRGDFLNLTASICGNRFGRGLVVPYGTGYDVDSSMVEKLLKDLDRIFDHFMDATGLLWTTPSVMERFESTGKLSRETAEQIGLVGPAARACGCLRDIRHSHPFGYYRMAQLPVATHDTGEVFARAHVRWLEVQASVEFIRQLLSELPKASQVCGKRDLNPAKLKSDSLSISMVEGWRGEICHAAITDKNGSFTRYKIVDPSFHNWTGLALALRNQQISDFPLCNKSFNLSYCGFDL